MYPYPAPAHPPVPTPAYPSTHRAAPSGYPAYGAAPNQPVQGLGYLLGQLGSGAADAALENPRIQQALDEFQVECKTRAKMGVSEWAKENWPVLAFGGIALLVGNYLVIAAALLQAGVRRRHIVRP